MKYTLCGIQIETEGTPEENVDKLISLFREACASKPDFVLFPEMFEIVPRAEDSAAYSHPIPSDITGKLSRMAAEYSVNIIAGSLFERDGSRIYNTSLVFDREGRLCGRYRKMHLFDAFGYGESKTISRGEEPFQYELDGLRFGVAICYDLRFAEMFRFYALGGAHIVFLPAAFFQPNHDHWELSIRSRALDNTIYVMSCNHAGKRFFGRSMVVNPWGIPIAAMGGEEGYYRVEIDTSLIKEIRKDLPLLENRQFDVVKRG